ncbi:MAG: permease-like cell division protein FtsX [Intestinimonas sp.]|jgi:cell division transport system permease protein|nr:permease-like cell division protein FtsX [Intestinimonas sp.]
MRQYNTGYQFKEGFHSIFAHGLMSFAAVCMIVACLIIMGSFSLVAVNLDNTLGDLEAQNEFTAYIDDSLSETEIQKLQSQIEAIPNVSTVTFVSREQALQDYIQRYSDSENSDLFQSLPQEVLRNRFQIHVVSIEDISSTVQSVEQVNGIAKVRAELEIAQGFVAVRNVASAVAFILVMLLLVISLFIIANTIKLTTFHRREEIAIMKMCGATNWFIRWPFIFEGMLLGFAGAVIAFFIQWGIYSLILNAVANYGGLQLLDIIPFRNLAGRLGVTFGGAGLLIGGGGSLLAIRKFLQV